MTKYQRNTPETFIMTEIPLKTKKCQNAYKRPKYPLNLKMTKIPPNL